MLCIRAEAFCQPAHGGGEFILTQQDGQRVAQNILNGEQIFVTGDNGECFDQQIDITFTAFNAAATS
jgi:hypothetical protein